MWAALETGLLQPISSTTAPKQPADELQRSNPEEIILRHASNTGTAPGLLGVESNHLMRRAALGLKANTIHPFIHPSVRPHMQQFYGGPVFLQPLKQ